jgi:hypothetical protein
MRRPSAARGGGRLERIAKARAHGALECGSIESDTQVPSAGDNGIIGGEQFGSEDKRITNADAKLHV